MFLFGFLLLLRLLLTLLLFLLLLRTAFLLIVTSVHFPAEDSLLHFTLASVLAWLFH